MNSPNREHGQAGGSALLLCVVLLFALTLLATALAADHRFQSRIHANQTWSNEARHNSMRALAVAEDWLRALAPTNRPGPCADTCTSSHLVWQDASVPAEIAFLGTEWWVNHAQSADTSNLDGQSQPGSDGPGYWLISEIEVPAEHLERLETPSTYYRVIALGADRHGTAQFIGESVFIKPWTTAYPATIDPPEADGQGTCRPAIDPPCGRVAWRRLR